jgi:hypothetical protein
MILVYMYLDILLKLGDNCKLTTPFHDIRDDFNFSIINSPYPCSNIPSLPVHAVYISQLIQYARACSTYDQYLIQGSLLADCMLMSQRFL